MASRFIPAHARPAARVALVAVLVGVVILALRFIAYGITGSAAVLSDALEAIINIVTASVALFSVRLSSLPADEEHPFGHGKVEFLALGFEGGMIFAAGCSIAYVGVRRLAWPAPPLQNLDIGTGLVAGIGALVAALAAYVYISGRRHHSAVLVADAKHLATDVLTSFGVAVGLLLVKWTGHAWLDPVIALVLAALIFTTSWPLLREAADGLMDHTDTQDRAVVCALLDDEVRRGRIYGYHKVRVRYTGNFHWIDMHLQVDPFLTVRQGHALASDIEYRVEQAVGPATKASAHIEPPEAADPPPAPGAPDAPRPPG